MHPAGVYLQHNKQNRNHVNITENLGRNNIFLFGKIIPRLKTCN